MLAIRMSSHITQIQNHTLLSLHLSLRIGLYVYFHCRIIHFVAAFLFVQTSQSFHFRKDLLLVTALHNFVCAPAGIRWQTLIIRIWSIAMVS